VRQCFEAAGDGGRASSGLMGARVRVIVQPDDRIKDGTRIDAVSGR
jgi:hypothetical protein